MWCQKWDKELHNVRIKWGLVILFVDLTTLVCIKGESLPPVVALEGSLSARIDIINDERPLPSGCNPTKTEIVLIRSHGNGMKDIALCGMEADDLQCTYPDTRYHGVGKGLPRQLRVTDVNLDMAGDYLATITCVHHPGMTERVYQMTTTLYVQGFPTIPVITVMEISDESVSMTCEAYPRTQPSAFSENITYNWIIINHQLTDNPDTREYDDMVNVTYAFTKSMSDSELNVTCIAKEIGSDLQKQKIIVVELEGVSGTELTPTTQTTEIISPKQEYVLYAVTGVLGGVAVLALCVIICLIKYTKSKRVDSKRRTSKTTVVTITGTPMMSPTRDPYPTTPRSLSLSMHGDFGRASVDRAIWRAKHRLSSSVDALLHDDFAHDLPGIGELPPLPRFSEKPSDRTTSSIYECIHDPGDNTLKPMTSSNVVYSKLNEETRKKNRDFSVLYKIRDQDDQIDRNSMKSDTDQHGEPVGPPVPEHTTLSGMFENTTDNNIIGNNVNVASV